MNYLRILLLRGERLYMFILIFILCVTAASLVFVYVRMQMDIDFLYKQLEEIERGSHIELTLNSRQKALRRFCEKLNRVLTQKDSSHIQYEKAEKQLKQNITGLAHDIRTPLTGASGYVQLARECEDADKRNHYLDAAEGRLAELEDMLEEMFLYTKLTGEGFTLSMHKLQVLPLLSECLLSLYTRFEERGISPEIVFEEEDFGILADEEALRRIFLNLLQNALIHGEGDISIIQEENRLIFENRVSEDCTLIPEQIFDRFYKGESARRKGSSGLGLFIVKELMEKMNGRVLAELQDGSLRLILYFAL